MMDNFGEYFLWLLLVSTLFWFFLWISLVGRYSGYFWWELLVGTIGESFLVGPFGGYF